MAISPWFHRCNNKRFRIIIFVILQHLCKFAGKLGENSRWIQNHQILLIECSCYLISMDNRSYIGENVTQQEHAVQCAMMAEKEDGSVEVEIFHICNSSKMPLENKWIVKTGK